MQRCSVCKKAPDDSAAGGAPPKRWHEFTCYAATKYGDTVALTGSAPQLGGWDLARAVKLSCTGFSSRGGQYVWYARVELDTSKREEIEYKYVWIKADGRVQWDAGGNRALQADRCGEVDLFD
eukprot:TRINITY_DN18390_c0_g1_i1.p2 TRINITY_DN18390_c0_g1~~TRINITY_DN18390_c0_g1_i1.p2  ORF type:complete len:134 (-),score=36.92 TRINITY_DN18390_c0_g1_i1:70-438(-)